MLFRPRVENPWTITEKRYSKTAPCILKKISSTSMVRNTMKRIINKLLLVIIGLLIYSCTPKAHRMLIRVDDEFYKNYKYILKDTISLNMKGKYRFFAGELRYFIVIKVNNKGKQILKLDIRDIEIHSKNYILNDTFINSYKEFDEIRYSEQDPVIIIQAGEECLIHLYLTSNPKDIDDDNNPKIKKDEILELI